MIHSLLGLKVRHKDLILKISKNQEIEIPSEKLGIWGLQINLLERSC